MFQVTPAYVHDASRQCLSTADEIRGELASLKSTVLGFQSFWRGAASDQFELLMVDYDRNGQKIYNALMQIGTALAATHQNYSQAEATNTNNLAIHVPMAKLN